MVEVIEDLEQALATFEACEKESKAPVEGTGDRMVGRRKPAPTAFETDENGEAL